MVSTTKNIHDYDSLFNEMKKNKMFRNPHETVDTFLQELHVGENWFSNGSIELKIFRDSGGRDELVNNRRIIHPSIENIFHAA